MNILRHNTTCKVAIKAQDYIKGKITLTPKQKESLLT